MSISDGSPVPQSFYTGGRWAQVQGSRVIVDQMYVAYTPGLAGFAPVVLVHGGGMTGSVFESTPDARLGWAPLLNAAGHPVYVVDQPGRGRSRYHREIHGEVTHLDASWTERQMTAGAELGEWPQARRHTQWPGTGRRGDAVFDAFFASVVGHLADYRLTEPIVAGAVVALLEAIGPAVVLTHSQSGPFGWQVADRRPDLVRALVAVEPSGPPFSYLPRTGAPESPAVAKPYGLTATPLAFEPPLAEGEVLVAERDPTPRRADQAPCYRQAEPARQLPRLGTVPVLLVTGEASLHAEYDHGTVAFLRQAGVRVDHLELAEVGIHGNGHLMMAELNNADIVAEIARWIQASATHAPSGAASVNEGEPS